MGSFHFLSSEPYFHSDLITTDVSIVKYIDIYNLTLAELHKVICIWGPEVILVDVKMKE